MCYACSPTSLGDWTDGKWRMYGVQGPSLGDLPYTYKHILFKLRPKMRGPTLRGASFLHQRLELCSSTQSSATRSATENRSLFLKFPLLQIWSKNGESMSLCVKLKCTYLRLIVSRKQAKRFPSQLNLLTVIYTVFV